MHLRIEFLNGVSRSSSFDDPRTSEWPPHPARVYSALVEAHYAGEPSAAGRTALQWLEGLPPPSITASHAEPRDVAPHFVPVNDRGMMDNKINSHLQDLSNAKRRHADARDDKARKKAARDVQKFEKRLDAASQRVLDGAGAISDKQAIESLKGIPGPLQLKQPRTFPAMVPDDPVVWLHWDCPPAPEHHDALRIIASQVVRVGHSASLVSCRWTAVGPEPTHIPSDTGRMRLRTVRAGQLQALDNEFERSQATLPRILPFASTAYATADELPPEPLPESVHGEDWIVLRRVEGDSLPITRSVDVARAVRSAMLAENGSLPGFITGHHAGPSVPHLAFVPLPFVGNEHAKGQLLGVAFVPPRGLKPEEHQQLLRAIAAWVLPHEDHVDETQQSIPLAIGRNRMKLERVLPGQRIPATLRPDTWCRPECEWVSVTPVALGRNPGNLHSDRPDVRARATAKAKRFICDAVERSGLPTPVRVDILLPAPLPGSQPVSRFPSYPPQKGRTRRTRIHVRLTFATPVRGPILLGAGRYQGTGLFRPLEARHAGS